MSHQPARTNANGVTVTIGMVCNNDRFAITLPITNDDAGLTSVTQALDAITAVNNIIVPALIPCLSSDCSIVYISADGMLDGGIPARIDIPPGTIVGLRAAGAAPTSVAALLTYYEDPADGVVGQRMRTAKNFLAGIAASDIAGDLINGAVISSINTLAGHLLMGFTTALGGGNWYRNLSSVPAGRHAITSIRRIISTSVRQYVATQRRRLLPR